MCKLDLLTNYAYVYRHSTAVSSQLASPDQLAQRIDQLPFIDETFGTHETNLLRSNSRGARLM